MLVPYSAFCRKFGIELIPELLQKLESHCQDPLFDQECCILFGGTDGDAESGRVPYPLRTGVLHFFREADGEVGSCRLFNGTSLNGPSCNMFAIVNFFGSSYVNSIKNMFNKKNQTI